MTLITGLEIKDGIKIGVFGLGIELEGLVDKKLYKETKYNNPVEVATDITKTLKETEKCDLIICLSHLGYDYKNEKDKPSDLKLAAATQTLRGLTAKAAAARALYVKAQKELAVATTAANAAAAHAL